MDHERRLVPSEGVRFGVKVDGREVARAFLYVLHNELHPEPVGYLEDVYVEEHYRGRGIASELIEQVIEEAKRYGCYKIIATSRHSRQSVHAIYEHLGFVDWGREYRLDLLP